MSPDPFDDPRSLLEPADPAVYDVRSHAPGPSGRLPLTDDMLRNSPSGELFGLTQNVGMGWKPRNNFV